MQIEIKVPVLPKPSDSCVVSRIYVGKGQRVNESEPLLDIETDKVTLEVTAPARGVIEDIMIVQGDEVSSEQVVILLKESLEPEQIQSYDALNENNTKPDVKDMQHNELPNSPGKNTKTMGLIFGMITLAIAALFVLNG